MKIGLEGEKGCTENHARVKIGSKADDRTEQNHANENIQRRLHILNWPTVFPLPIPERCPPVDVIVKEQQDQRPIGVASPHAFRYA